MKTFRLIALLLSVVLVSVHVSAQEDTGLKMTGNWQGSLVLPNGAKIMMIFKISEEAGILKGALDVPMQGAKDIPVNEVAFYADSARFTVKLINGIFSGKYNEGNLDGNWVQNGVTLPLQLTRSEKPAELIRPQEPQKPFPYKEEEVTYLNVGAGIRLAGTLTLPEGDKKSPAVILISGSGAQDRNEEIFGHKPFLLLSDYLTRKGVAVLRVDDRGVGGSTGNIREATSEEFAGDVLAGIYFLKARADIDGTRIGLIGHSEGGIIAPLVAVRSEDVAFIVLLAGTGLPGEEILYQQGKLINRAMGMTEEQIGQNMNLQKAIFEVIRNEKDSLAAKQKLREAYTGGLYATLAEGQQEAIDKRIAAVYTPWFQFFLSYDPRPTLEKVKCPVLALTGEKDLQVDAGENLRAIGDALKKSGNPDFTTLKMEGLNHLFQTCKTGLISEYGELEETMSVKLLDTIAEWILEKTN